MRLFKVVLSLLMFAYFAAGTYLYVEQRSFVFFPSPVYEHEFAELELNNDNINVKTLIVNPGKRNALIFFGGNATKPAHQAVHLKEQFSDYTVYLMSYRGYGGSEGTPSEAGIFSDALQLFDHIKTEHDSIDLLGRSLGTGVASYVAANRNIHKLILVTPFDSIEQVAQGRYPMFPMSILLKDKFDSASRAQQITAPVLIFIAETDHVVPHVNTQNLIKAFTSSPLVVTVKNANHRNILTKPDFYKRAELFLSTSEFSE
ncbi:alpha/beta hydrolase [Algibacillus agarilyticus]|uniref:alpha/beta hydrolase n=1 Tax=Algibacillus agarilyticus TaxID=2234133 RepID=UPI000DD06B45|nr:alpha/beta fold hydrolase [Algibacillus agarilyticus]